MLLLGEDITVDLFDTLNFFRCQRSKFFLFGTLREQPVVLLQKAKEQVEGALGHVERAFDALAKFVVTAQEPSFVGQVMLDGALDAVIEKFRMRGRVEETVEITRVVQDPDIEVLGRRANVR